MLNVDSLHSFFTSLSENYKCARKPLCNVHIPPAKTFCYMGLKTADVTMADTFFQSKFEDPVCFIHEVSALETYLHDYTTPSEAAFAITQQLYHDDYPDETQGALWNLLVEALVELPPATYEPPIIALLHAIQQFPPIIRDPHRDLPRSTLRWPLPGPPKLTAVDFGTLGSFWDIRHWNRPADDTYSCVNIGEGKLLPLATIYRSPINPIGGKSSSGSIYGPVTRQRS